MGTVGLLVRLAKLRSVVAAPSIAEEKVIKM
jgi:hypothetical protein